MSEENELSAKPPTFRNLLTTGNLMSIGTMLVAVSLAWGSAQSDFRALAQRVEKGERTDEKTGEAIGTLKEAVIELRTDGKAIRSEQDRQGRQLDRIEQLLRRDREPSSTPPPR